MKITSSAFEHNKPIPEKYTCKGEGINPPLTISDTPANTQSLVLIIDDPDAPIGLWTHWTAWNIDPKTTEIKENSTPTGAIEGITSAKTNGWHPPCPPSGAHRYFFKIFALDTRLNLPTSTNPDQLKSAMQSHVLAQAELIGLFSH
ncbi:MAG: PEBP family protein [Candidatus Peregrinibacteria bacterium GW2011_GWC2_39_14]|nr:MAG: Phospholipid-binding protein, PBP family [Candidatus Peregrinibacteria bacterium GW2011_GWA2_38_36]KKR05919.1 MAG: PEBP family protein [Candidatus Peregrinibacteria bacterium GW2011_GWC2_39_14]